MRMVSFCIYDKFSTKTAEKKFGLGRDSVGELSP